jgi:hypothetical protein
MLDALVSGTTDSAVLADPARGQLRKKLPALRAPLGQDPQGLQVAPKPPRRHSGRSLRRALSHD